MPAPPRHGRQVSAPAPLPLIPCPGRTLAAGNWQYVVDTTHPENPLLTDEAAQAGKPTLKDDVVATCEKLGFEVGPSTRQVLQMAPAAH